MASRSEMMIKNKKINRLKLILGKGVMSAILASSFALFGYSAYAQSIPKELWGKWRINHSMPIPTVGCWGSPEEKLIEGTEIEYTSSSFRWKNVIVKNPVIKIEDKTIDGIEGMYSSPGHNPDTDFKVSAADLGLVSPFYWENSNWDDNSRKAYFKAREAYEKKYADKKFAYITVEHLKVSANLPNTDEIPGDNVLLKNGDTLIMTVCGGFFEAKRIRSS